MKLLATSDLHGVPSSSSLGVLARERGCALVIIAGDFLDLCGKGTPGEQARASAAWLQRLATEIPVVACSGNHDPNGIYGAGWLRLAAEAVSPAGRLTVDGGHAIHEGLVVSAMPYWHIFERGGAHQHWVREQVQSVWREGRRLAHERNLPWAVLHHEPPDGLAVAAGSDEVVRDGHAPPLGWCRQWIELYRPDYVFSGHIHEAPLLRGGSWAAQVPETGTWCFNPGRYNQHCGLIELDTDRRIARWLPPWKTEVCLSVDLGPAVVKT